MEEYQTIKSNISFYQELHILHMKQAQRYQELVNKLSAQLQLRRETCEHKIIDSAICNYCGQVVNKRKSYSDLIYISSGSFDERSTQAKEANKPYFEYEGKVYNALTNQYYLTMSEFISNAH